MAKDLICNEDEIAIAIKKIRRHIEFLSECFLEYSTILNKIPGAGIEDENISNALRALAGRVSTNNTLAAETESLENITVGYLRELESADNFSYPELSMGDIIGLLASFL